MAWTCKQCFWATPAPKKDPEKPDGFVYCETNRLYMWGDDYCSQHPELLREQAARKEEAKK